MKHIKLFENSGSSQYSYDLLTLVKNRNMMYTFQEYNRNGNFEIVFGNSTQGEGGTSRDERFKIIIDNSSSTPFFVYKGDKEIAKETSAEKALNLIH